MIGTSDQSCWLAEACNVIIILLLLLHTNAMLEKAEIWRQRMQEFQAKHIWLAWQAYAAYQA